MDKPSTYVEMSDLTLLSAEELTSIVWQGAVLRLPYWEAQFLQAQEQIRRFESKYGTTIDVLTTQGLPDNATYELHEDFIEWEYWNDLMDKTRSTIEKVKSILAKLEAVVGVH